MPKRQREYGGGSRSAKRSRRNPPFRGTAKPIMVIQRPPGNPRALTERKYFDSTVDNVAMTDISLSWASARLDPTTLSTLFAPTQGDSYNNRDGRKVLLAGIRINWQCDIATQTNQSAADAGSKVRLLLVQDLQTNGVQLNSEDVITSGSAKAGVCMHQNPAYFGRFKVWKDKVFVMENPAMTNNASATTIQQNGLTRFGKWKLNFKKPIPINYNTGNAGTVADIVDNSFHIIGGYAGGLTPNFSAHIRCIFLDR